MSDKRKTGAHDAYLAGLPLAQQAALEKVRRAIRIAENAPQHRHAAAGATRHR